MVDFGIGNFRCGVIHDCYTCRPIYSPTQILARQCRECHEVEINIEGIWFPLKKVARLVHDVEEILQANAEAELAADNQSRHIAEDRVEDHDRLVDLGRSHLFHKEETNNEEDNKTSI